jgi:hypothetical protein
VDDTDLSDVIEIELMQHDQQLPRILGVLFAPSRLCENQTDDVSRKAAKTQRERKEKDE